MRDEIVGALADVKVGVVDCRRGPAAGAEVDRKHRPDGDALPGVIGRRRAALPGRLALEIGKNLESPPRSLLVQHGRIPIHIRDRKSTRLNSSHLVISYAVFCLKKKKK